jgi:hypothetical protein
LIHTTTRDSRITPTPQATARPFYALLRRRLAGADVGAHRESAAQYSRAVRFAESLTCAERADLLHARAYQ